jgi:hypothetical protein
MAYNSQNEKNEIKLLTEYKNVTQKVLFYIAPLAESYISW